LSKAAVGKEMTLHKMRLRRAAVMTAVSLLILSCNDRTVSSEIPEELIGKWKTDAPKYRGCYLELKERSVAFISGEGDSDFNMLNGIETRRDGESFLYTIHYKCEDGYECTMKLYYENSGRRVIRLKNQKNIEWTKMED
jgi:hypothetical protein